MPNVSARTKAVAFRIPIETYEAIERLISKSSKQQKVQEYIKERIISEVESDDSSD